MILVRRIGSRISYYQGSWEIVPERKGHGERYQRPCH